MNLQEREKEAFLLTSENINEAAKRMNKELEKYGCKEDLLRLRLAFEDILSIWQRTLGEGTVCTIRYGKRFGKWSMQLTAAGTISDPNSDSLSADIEIAGNVILESLGLYPAFEYKNGINCITLSLPKEKPNQLFYLLGAGIVSVILGLFSLNMPNGIKAVFVDQLATPVLDMLLGLLSGVAMPMIFLSISMSIVNMGNVASLGRIGKKFLTCFMAVAFAAPLLTVLLYIPTVTISAGNTKIGQFQAIFSMIIGIVPRNIVSPFIDGNTLQIIFLGFCVGVALLILNGKTQTLTDCMKQLQSVTNIFMDGINRLLPLFVFLMLYRITASGSISKLSGAIKIVVMTIVALFVLSSCITAYFCLRLRVPVRVVIKKSLPFFIVSLSTASSMASFSARVACSKKDFGLDSQTTNFTLPLAQVLLKPEVGITFAIAALCVGNTYGVAITPMWLIMCSLVASLLSIATPPVPGGGQMAYAALFLPLGIPAEGLMLALAAETILDFVCTAVGCYVQLLLIVLTSDQLNKVDMDILRSANVP